AVTASTLTTVAVFFPISFVEGVAGELFGDLSLAVVASLLASLAVALVLVPMLAALEMPDASSWVRPGRVKGARRRPRPARPALPRRELAFVRVRHAGGSLVALLSREPDQPRKAWVMGIVRALRRRVISEPLGPVRSWVSTVR